MRPTLAAIMAIKITSTVPVRIAPRRVVCNQKASAASPIRAAKIPRWLSGLNIWRGVLLVSI